MAGPKDATQNIVASVVPERVVHVPRPQHCRKEITDEERPKDGSEPAAAMARELVLKTVPGHRVAETIRLEGVVVEVVEAMNEMGAGAGHGRLGQPMWGLNVTGGLAADGVGTMPARHCTVAHTSRVRE